MQDQPIISRLGQPFVELQSIDSTNNYALDHIRKAKARHGSTFYAHEQTAGKGQRGRKWEGESGANIAMSIVLEPRPLPVSSQFHLSACIAVAVQKFFSRYAGAGVTIKWPNDLYWMDKKAGGILIENIIAGKRKPENTRDGLPQNTDTGSYNQPVWRWAVAGIGININQTRFPDDLPNAISLKQITGKTFSTVPLAKELCDITNDLFTGLINEGFDTIYEDYNNSLYKRGESIKLKKGDWVLTTTVKGVTTEGQLVTYDGIIESKFNYGDVIWLRE